MAKNSVKQNFAFNTIYQVFSMLIPFITVPYVSRVLGAENIGIYSYAASITSIFTLVGLMGTKLYGQREIAYVQDDKKKRSKRFWEIFILRSVTSFLSFFVFFGLFVLGSNQYSPIFLILGLNFLTDIFDISWFYQGMEEFKKVTIRNGIIKILGIIPIFIFVRTGDDLVPYVLIAALSALIGSFSLWPFLPRYVEKINFSRLEVWRHLKPTFLLFLPQIAAQVYTVLDTAMLGTLVADKAETGYYEQAQKTINLLLTIIISLSTVMMPKIASCVNKKSSKLNYYMKKSFEAIYMLALPIMFGAIACANNFVPIFLGDGFEKTSILLQIMAVVLPCVGLASVVGIQYLIPMKRQNQYTISVAIAAMVNVIFNLIFIPIYGSVGAAIGTVIAEGLGIAIQLFFIRKDFDVKKIFAVSTKYLFAAVIMFGICELLNLLDISLVAKISLQIVVGSVSYFSLLILFRASLFMEFVGHIFKKNTNR